jgi:hypothetical protein
MGCVKLLMVRAWILGENGMTMLGGEKQGDEFGWGPGK